MLQVRDLPLSVVVAAAAIAATAKIGVSVASICGGGFRLGLGLGLIVIDHHEIPELKQTYDDSMMMIEMKIRSSLLAYITGT